MRRIWSTMRSFWMAEEVPRWFGLSIVLIYLVGLGAMAYLGTESLRRAANESLTSSYRFSVTTLAARLSDVWASAPNDSSLRDGLQRELFEFAANLPARYARVLDSRRRVIASNHSEEIGHAVPMDAPRIDSAGPVQTGFVSVWGQQAPDHWMRVPLVVVTGSEDGVNRGVEGRPIEPGGDTETGEPASASGAVLPGGGGEREPAVGDTAGRVEEDDANSSSEPPALEVRLVSALEAASGLATQIHALVAMLVVLGALFVSYRCLRTQLRGPAQIVQRLQLYEEQLENNLHSLRLATTVDSVTEAWNRLVDFTQSLAETARRSAANDELSKVLVQSSGGALADAVQALPEGLLYFGPEGRLEHVNTAGMRLFGWSGDSVRGAVLNGLRAQALGERLLEEIRKAVHSDGAIEARSCTVDSAEPALSDRSTYRVNVIPLPQTHRLGEFIVTIRDVSQQVRADRAREEFITQVTHELRTPLTNIRAYTETLASGMFEDPKVITECYNVITKETRRLSRLVEDILSVSQMEVGSIELHPNHVDLRALLTESVRDVRGLADDKGIDLQLILPAKMESILADRDKLAVVINNLLGNAIKYTTRQGNVVVGCQMQHDRVIITVKDNGIGIDPTDHARIFEKFQRVNDPAVLAETGTGIGLYTAREIARRHGGDIEVISEKGSGSTFMVRLPHQESRASTMTTQAES